MKGTYSESHRNFETNRILAGVGALLTAIGSLVVFSGPIGILGIVGIVLLLISLRGLSDYFRDHVIFKSAATGFIFGVVGVAIAIGVFAAFAFLTGFIFAHPVAGALGLVGVIAAWFIMYAFFIVETIFLKRSFDILASRSLISLLRTGGTILLIGGALTVVFVGFFLMFVAWIIIAAGLFSMREPVVEVQASPYSPAFSTSPESSEQVKHCPYCGAENRADGTFCTHCGRRLNPN